MQYKITLRFFFSFNCALVQEVGQEYFLTQIQNEFRKYFRYAIRKYLRYIRSFRLLIGGVTRSKTFYRIQF